MSLLMSCAFWYSVIWMFNPMTLLFYSFLILLPLPLALDSCLISLEHTLAIVSVFAKFSSGIHLID